MQTAVIQYSKQRTTMANTRESTSHLDPPVFVACPDPPFKTSFFRDHPKLSKVRILMPIITFPLPSILVCVNIFGGNTQFL